MSNKQFKAGDTVYDLSGNAWRYIGPCATGHAVEAIFEEEEDGPIYYDQPSSLPHVFAKPPRQKLGEDLSDVTERITQRQQELQALNDEIFQADRLKRTALASAKADAQLSDLVLWLEGKATHMMRIDYSSLSIGPIKDLLNDRDGELRLLSLYVDTKVVHRYSVQMSAYCDGSGNSRTNCRLASSEDHAMQLAREFLAERMRHGSDSQDLSWIREAIKFGVPVTDEQKRRVEQHAKEVADRAVQHARDTLERAKRDLEAAEAKHGASA